MKRPKIGEKREEGLREITEELTPEELKKLYRLYRSSYKVATDREPRY